MTYSITKSTIILAAITMVVGVGASSPAFARPAGALGPRIEDAGVVRAEPAAGTQPCFVEPTGFRSQIRWDKACATAQVNRSEHVHDSATSSKFVAPTGFHSQIRFD